MEFVKLPTTYYNDGALMRAGEAAEILWCRAKAYAGEKETDGFIPAEMLPRLCPTRGKARAAALVKEGLWFVVDGGWVDVRWATERQATKESLSASRSASAQRVARHRQKTRNGVTLPARNGVTNADVAGTEVEVDVEDAAAAASATPLPPPLEILRSSLEASRLVVRWDQLTSDQHAEIEHLVEVHGDGPLVRSALAQHRPASPAAFAQAWLSAWRNLTPPGTPLHLVEPCTEWGHTGTVQHCVQCSSEAKAVDR